MIQDILNMFQKDWAVTPSDEAERFDKLKNKCVLICGHELARAFTYTLLAANDRRKLNIRVILTSPEKHFDDTLLSGVVEREDCTYSEIGRLDGLKHKPDCVIYTGLCQHRIDNSLEEYLIETDALEAVMNYSEKCGVKQFVLLSESRVYGKGSNKFRAFSETEMGFALTKQLDVQLIRAVENRAAKYFDGKKIKLTILRTGLVLAPGAGLYNGLEDVFKAVAQGKEIELYNTENRLSFIYMSDLSLGVLYAFKKELEGVYNLAGEAASTGIICALLHDHFGSDMKVKLSEKGRFDGNLLNCGKLKFAGFEPVISLNTALELCVRSYREDTPADFHFPDEHEGRLNSIQQVLLAYLLEVDRICKKHNIRWYLGGGTLLGAARHKGFIPWDDDVDIMMLREDYDKFLEVAADELPEGMILQDPKKDKTYNYCYARLRIEDTMFATDFSKNHKGMNNGFFFDIFCHDKTANSKIGQKLHSQLTLFWLAMVFNKWNHRRVYNGKKVQSAISNFLKNIFPLRFSMRMLLFTLEMFKHKKRAKYLYDGMGKSVHKGGFDKSFLEGEIRLDFCGEKMPVPVKYKEYLTNHYGDYMELSPLTSRLMGHEITLVDLGKYADFKIMNNE